MPVFLPQVQPQFPASADVSRPLALLGDTIGNVVGNIRRQSLLASVFEGADGKPVDANTAAMRLLQAGEPGLASVAASVGNTQFQQGIEKSKLGLEERKVGLAEKQAEDKPQYQVFEDADGNKRLLKINPYGRGINDVTPPDLLPPGTAGSQGGAPRVAIPSGAVDALRAKPELRDQFEAKYGAGSAAAALGGGAPASPGVTLNVPARPPAGVNAPAYRKEIAQQTAKIAVAQPEAETNVNETLAGLDRLKSLAQEIRRDPATGRITGLTGVFPSIPGSQASDLEAKFDSLKSQVGFSVLQSMRNSSKTGGALGQISNFEEKLLQDNLAALSQKQSTESFLRNLDKVIGYVDGAKSRLTAGYRNTYGMAPRNPGGQ